jgi:hypothetical protein
VYLIFHTIPSDSQPLGGAFLSLSFSPFLLWASFAIKKVKKKKKEAALVVAGWLSSSFSWGLWAKRSQEKGKEPNFQHHQQTRFPRSQHSIFNSAKSGIIHGRLNASWKICSLVVNRQSFLVIDGYLLNLF